MSCADAELCVGGWVVLSRAEARAAAVVDEFISRRVPMLVVGLLFTWYLVLFYFFQ